MKTIVIVDLKTLELGESLLTDAEIEEIVEAARLEQYEGRCEGCPQSE